jgi:iron complex transport system permease protein
VWAALTGDEDVNHIYRTIVLQARLPQALTAIVAGAGLAVSGLMMQTIFRNPLAGPSVMGISSGASIGVALVVLLSGTLGGTALSRMGIMGDAAMSLAAIVGAMAVMILIMWVAQYVKSKTTLLIVGVMIGYVAQSIVGVLKFFSNEEDVRAYVVWGLGSFSRVSGDQMLLFVLLMVILLPLSLLFMKTLNQLLLGDMYAENLGLNVKKARMLCIAMAGTLVAIVTAYCGPIMFLGLAVPHLCRMWLRTADHRQLLPATIMMGAMLALACSIIARLPGMEGALPVNSVTALIGAPVVAMVVLRKN